MRLDACGRVAVVEGGPPLLLWLMAPGKQSRRKILSIDEAHRLSTKLLAKLGKRARDKYAAIDLRSGEIYLGDTSLEAVERGLSASPHGQFQIERPGRDVAGMMKSRK